MSIKTIQSRLRRATLQPWRLDAEGCCVLSFDSSNRTIAIVRYSGAEGTKADAELIANAPTDLALLLDIAKEAAELLDILGEEGRRAIPPAAALRGTLNALEAAP